MTFAQILLRQEKIYKAVKFNELNVGKLPVMAFESNSRASRFFIAKIVGGVFLNKL